MGSSEVIPRPRKLSFQYRVFGTDLVMLHDPQGLRSHQAEPKNDGAFQAQMRSPGLTFGEEINVARPMRLRTSRFWSLT